MARQPRVVIPGAPHHITLRGNNRRKLFSYPRDYRYFLRLLAKGVRPGEVAVHGLCLMSNHVHVLLTPAHEQALGGFVKRCAQRYAQVRNKRFGATGKLFEERYFSEPLRSEESVAVVSAYIDLNPVRAGICANPAAYNWSSYRLHAGRGASELPGRLLTPTDWYARLGDSVADRTRAYRDWVQECRNATPDAESQTADERQTAGAPPIRPNRSRAAG